MYIYIHIYIYKIKIFILIFTNNKKKTSSRLKTSLIRICESIVRNCK